MIWLKRVRVVKQESHSISLYKARVFEVRIKPVVVYNKPDNMSTQIIHKSWILEAQYTNSSPNNTTLITKYVPCRLAAEKRREEKKPIRPLKDISAHDHTS